MRWRENLLWGDETLSCLTALLPHSRRGAASLLAVPAWSQGTGCVHHRDERYAETKKSHTEATRKKEWMKRLIGEIHAPETINGTIVFRLRLPERKSRRRSVLLYSGLLRLLRDLPGFQWVAGRGRLPLRKDPLGTVGICGLATERMTSRRDHIFG